VKNCRGPGGLLVAGALVAGGCVASSGAIAPSSNLEASPTPSFGAVAPTTSPAPPPSPEPLSPDQAWALLIPGDPAAISYPSLEAIVRAADLVVVGRLGNLAYGPTNADEYGVIGYMTSLSVEVDRVLLGAPRSRVPGTVTLWVVLGLGDRSYDYRPEFERLSAAISRGERAIFFLVNMAEKASRNGFPLDDPQADPYAYQILGGQGFLRDVAGRVEPPQLSEDALGRMAGRWQLALRGRPFDEVVAEIAALAAGG
jgi:hypothetical protein